MSSYRKLLSADAPSIARHLLRLDDADRRCRFHCAASDETVEAHVKEIDWLRAVAIGYFDGGELRGVAELCFNRFWMPSEAELAVTVESGWQHHGVGTELVQRAATLARNRGASTLTMMCLTENQSMRRIAARLSGTAILDGGQIESQVGLPDPTPMSLMMEAVQQASDKVEAFADDWLAATKPS